jgi:hypothetical protein
MAKAKSTSSPQRFLVTFDRLEDPAPDLLARVDHRLKFYTQAVESIVPGIFRVQGNEQDLFKAVGDLPDWKFAREGQLSSPSPARTRIRNTG